MKRLATFVLFVVRLTWSGAQACSPVAAYIEASDPRTVPGQTPNGGGRNGKLERSGLLHRDDRVGARQMKHVLVPTPTT